ncbi:hypothetical protein ABK040_005749 [Willaertia magna]
MPSSNSRDQQQQEERVFKALFMPVSEELKELENEDELKEKVLTLLKNKDNIKEITTIHPYYGHLTITKQELENLKDLKHVLILIKNFNLFKIIAITNNNELNLFNNEMNNEWELINENDKYRLIHFGRDNEMLNNSLQNDYKDFNFFGNLNDENLYNNEIKLLNNNNFTNILNNLDVMNIILQYLNFSELQDFKFVCKKYYLLINNREFILDLVLQHCKNIPLKYLENKQIELRELTNKELFKNYKLYKDYKISFTEMSITWMNGDYWKVEECDKSLFGKVATLNYVWWFEVSKVFPLKKGKYEVYLKYKLKYDSRTNEDLTIVFATENTDNEIKVDVCPLSNSLISKNRNKQDWMETYIGTLETTMNDDRIYFGFRGFNTSGTKSNMSFDYLELRDWSGKKKTLGETKLLSGEHTEEANINVNVTKENTQSKCICM